MKGSGKKGRGERVGENGWERKGQGERVEEDGWGRKDGGGGMSQLVVMFGIILVIEKLYAYQLIVNINIH